MAEGLDLFLAGPDLDTAPAPEILQRVYDFLAKARYPFVPHTDRSESNTIGLATLPDHLATVTGVPMIIAGYTADLGAVSLDPAASNPASITFSTVKNGNIYRTDRVIRNDQGKILSVKEVPYMDMITDEGEPVTTPVNETFARSINVKFDNPQEHLENLMGKPEFTIAVLGSHIGEKQDIRFDDEGFVKSSKARIQAINVWR
ncbi:hypothetical protein A2Z33_04395 [Candidatus Gottesmanbacteria bacterium RBG_16_52_11]|uniref:Uncharacterized protein n=1 Tax=Candidatus Gottesmanbacteria bacterium RBG_16_52_11 TaxID=1798374 RepID=A0A1F5YWU7_9BACT|nr:MAG: hypothetical protein A2Z33_04395 [Candidatus Gottesmanbacteria bacterium RBG_16_52_11]